MLLIIIISLFSFEAANSENVRFHEQDLTQLQTSESEYND